MKYPPVGERSWGPTFALPRSGLQDLNAFLRESNGRTLSFAMIETRAALEALDGILDTAGIDGVFLGPADFSIAWTNGATVNATLEDMMETVAAIAARARQADKLAAIFVPDPTLTGRFVSMGYRFLAIGTDQRCIAIGAASLLQAARGSIG